MATPWRVLHADDRGRSTGAAAHGAQCRCDCGCLLARLTPAGVELKCRRCKRLVVLPFPATVRGGAVRS